MKAKANETRSAATAQERPPLTGSHRKTLEAIFRHPSAQNLEWRDVVALIEKIGTIDQKANREFALEVSGEHHLIHKPHTKDLTGSDVIELRGCQSALNI